MPRPEALNDVLQLLWGDPPKSSWGPDPHLGALERERGLNAKCFGDVLGRFSRTSLLRPLQKHFVNIFFEFAWEFSIEKWRGFLVIFFWAPFPRNEAWKLLKKFGENSERNSGQNPGQTFEENGELSFCDFSDLKEPLNAPFLNGPFSRGFSRGKTAH